MSDRPQLTITGGCNCGAVRYEVVAPFASASYCHCRRCQRRSGAAASANAAVEPGSFRLLKGEDQLKAWTPEDGWEKWFCGDCGSALFSRDPINPRRVGIRLGTVDGDPGVRPRLHQYVSYSAPWNRCPTTVFRGTPKPHPRASSRQPTKYRRRNSD